MIEEEALPSRIFDCPGTVVIYQVDGSKTTTCLKNIFRRLWLGQAFWRWRMGVGKLFTVSFWQGDTSIEKVVRFPN